MDDLENREEELYAKAFNHGYYLQRFKPEIANKISETSHAHNIYLQTFNDGRECYLEEVKDRLKDFQHTPPNHSQDRGMDIDR
jgi:hypothetical protein